MRGGERCLLKTSRGMDNSAYRRSTSVRVKSAYLSAGRKRRRADVHARVTCTCASVTRVTRFLTRACESPSACVRACVRAWQCGAVRGSGVRNFRPAAYMYTSNLLRGSARAYVSFACGVIRKTPLRDSDNAGKFSRKMQETFPSPSPLSLSLSLSLVRFLLARCLSRWDHLAILLAVSLRVTPGSIDPW